MKDCIFSNNLYYWGLGNSLETRELAAVPSDLNLVRHNHSTPSSGNLTHSPGLHGFLHSQYTQYTILTIPPT